MTGATVRIECAAFDGGITHVRACLTARLGLDARESRPLSLRSGSQDVAAEASARRPVRYPNKREKPASIVMIPVSTAVAVCII